MFGIELAMPSARDVGRQRIALGRQVVLDVEIAVFEQRDQGCAIVGAVADEERGMIEPPGAFVAMALDAVARDDLVQRPPEQRDHAASATSDGRRPRPQGAKPGQESGGPAHPARECISRGGAQALPVRARRGGPGTLPGSRCILGAGRQAMTDGKTWLQRHRRLLLFVLLLAAIEASLRLHRDGRAVHGLADLEHELRPAGGGLPVRPPLPGAGAGSGAAREANPFDPRWRSLWFWDASLYGEHYYLYWGPLPAVALAIVKTVFRIRGTVGDQSPAVRRLHDLPGRGALLIARLARRLFDGVPAWLTALCIAVFAWANPTPYLIATPGIYEAAIAGGQAFLVLGLLARVRSDLARTTTGRAAGCWSRRGCRGDSRSRAGRARSFPPRSSPRSPRWPCRRPRPAARLARAAAPGALDRGADRGDRGGAPRLQQAPLRRMAGLRPRPPALDHAVPDRARVPAPQPLQLPPAPAAPVVSLPIRHRAGKPGQRSRPGSPCPAATPRPSRSPG